MAMYHNINTKINLDHSQIQYQYSSDLLSSRIKPFSPVEHYPSR